MEVLWEGEGGKRVEEEGGRGRRKRKGREHTTFCFLFFFFSLIAFSRGPARFEGDNNAGAKFKIEDLDVTQRGGILQGRWGKESGDILVTDLQGTWPWRFTRNTF